MGNLTRTTHMLTSAISTSVVVDSPSVGTVSTPGRAAERHGKRRRMQFQCSRTTTTPCPRTAAQDQYRRISQTAPTVLIAGTPNTTRRPKSRLGCWLSDHAPRLESGPAIQPGHRPSCIHARQRQLNDAMSLGRRDRPESPSPGRDSDHSRQPCSSPPSAAGRCGAGAWHT